MREELLRGIHRLCWLYPPLSPVIQYSSALSQGDVDLFAAFANGHVQQILHDFPTDEKHQEREIASLLKCSTGLAKIRAEDVQHVESILAAAGNDNSISPEMRDIADFLRNHKKLWWSLHDTYEKIVKQHLIGTCPLVVAKPLLLDRVLPFGRRMHRFQEFHKLFHESIHYVLEENGIRFNDSDLDEGLVTYLHQQVMGDAVRYFHYTGEEGERYVNKAAFFSAVLDQYPKSAVVPIVRNMVGIKAL